MRAIKVMSSPSMDGLVIMTKYGLSQMTFKIFTSSIAGSDFTPASMVTALASTFFSSILSLATCLIDLVL